MAEQSTDAPTTLAAVPLPTISAWSTPPVPPSPPPDGEPPPPPPKTERLLDNMPMLVFGVLILAQIGFAVIFAYSLFSLGHRMDLQGEALDDKITRLMRSQEGEAREQATIKVEQATRKDLVLRIPGIQDMQHVIQRDLVEAGTTAKLTSAQARQNQLDIEKLRRDFDVLQLRVQDLTYVRQRKIPVEEVPPHE